MYTYKNLVKDHPRISSFLQGMGSIMDLNSQIDYSIPIGISRNDLKQSPLLKEISRQVNITEEDVLMLLEQDPTGRDTLAIYLDWLAVGKNLDNSIQRVKKEIE